MSGQLFGYGSLPKAAPSQLPLLLPGVKNCVVNLMDTQPGERFLIIAENTVDPVVVEAFEAVAGMIGADVTTMRIKPFSPAGIDPNNPSDVVVQAYAGRRERLDAHGRNIRSNHTGNSFKSFN